MWSILPFPIENITCSFHHLISIVMLIYVLKQDLLDKHIVQALPKCKTGHSCKGKDKIITFSCCKSSDYKFCDSLLPLPRRFIM